MKKKKSRIHQLLLEIAKVTIHLLLQQLLPLFSGPPIVCHLPLLLKCLVLALVGQPLHLLLQQLFLDLVTRLR